MPVTPQQVDLIPLAIYALIAVVLISGLLLAARYLGSGKESTDKRILSISTSLRGFLRTSITGPRLKASS